MCSCIECIGDQPEPTANELADEILRLRNQVELGQQVVNLGVGLMTKEQVGKWVGVRHFLEAGTEMYPPFTDAPETPNVEFSGTPAASLPEAPLERRVGPSEQED